MKRKISSARGLVLLVALVLCLLSGCGRQAPLTQAELDCLNRIDGSGYALSDCQDVTGQLLAGREEKFKAVEKAALLPDGRYGFITAAVGYNGPVTLAVLLDPAAEVITGAAVTEQMETELYVRDFYNPWFMDRFRDKPLARYLQVVQLQAAADNEIVAITCATVTAEAVVNGVNAAIGLYQEAVLGLDAPTPDYIAAGSLQ